MKNDINKKLLELINLFDCSNELFIANNYKLFKNQISERTLCGALMIELHKAIKRSKYKKYYVDVEYNRNAGQVKTINISNNGSMQIVRINCDLIVHSRGEIIEQDNLIAVEMKKSTATQIKKLNDKIRLECLTRKNDVWPCKNVLPEHVCGYILGVYYEINFNNKEILIEYYHLGEKIKSKVIKYDAILDK